MNRQRAEAMVSFFLQKGGGALNDVKLMKLLYISDRESLRRMSETISGDEYYSIFKGPILKGTLDAITEEGSFSSVRFIRQGEEGLDTNTVQLMCAIDPDTAFSDAEIDLLEDIWSEYGSMTKEELVNLTHSYPEYHKQSEIDKRRRHISLKSILTKGLGFSESKSEGIIQDIKYFTAIEA